MLRFARKCLLNNLPRLKPNKFQSRNRWSKSNADLTESRHRGHIVAIEPDGNIVAFLGAPETVTFLRSSAKPFQAMPLLVFWRRRSVWFHGSRSGTGVRLTQRRTDSH